MAEPGRRTVVIRGQVVDRYSPRLSVESGAATRHGPRRPTAESRVAGYGARRSRPLDYEPRRSSSNRRSRSRPRRPYDPPRARPDRIAMWAVLLGIVLLLAAATSSHAAVLAHAVH